MEVSHGRVTYGGGFEFGLVWPGMVRFGSE